MPIDKWREDLREILFCIDIDVEKYVESLIYDAREEWRKMWKGESEKIKWLNDEKIILTTALTRLWDSNNDKKTASNIGYRLEKIDKIISSL